MDEALAAKVVFFLAFLAAFVLPGYWWATWLHGGRFDRPFRLALGFAWSFALFTLIGGPFLWFQGSYAGFQRVLYPVWAWFTLASFLLWRRGSSVDPSKDEQGSARPAAAPAGKTSAPPAGAGWVVLLLLACFAAFAAGVLPSWLAAYEPTPKKELLPPEKVLLACPFLLALGGGLAWACRRKLAPLLAFTAADDGPPPRAWTALAVSFVVLQAIGAVVYFRPDWDDCYYLAAVRDFPQAEVFNDRDPPSREGDPVDAVHRVMCLELWGAVACHLTGADPQTMFHTLLPGFLVLAAYAAYSGLLALLLPRRWVPLALLGLSGYFVWGICGTFSSNNHFLIRVWQGKALLLHLALPLITVLLLQFAQRPSLRLWLSLCASICCGLGFSSTALFLAPALVGCLSLALLPGMKTGRLVFLGGAALALLPVVIEGAGVYLEYRPQVAQTVRAKPTPSPQGASAAEKSDWFEWFLDLHYANSGEGSADLLWLLLLPLLVLLVRDRRRLAYLVFFPALLLATFANPFLYRLVTAHVTSPEGYYRLFWLLPIGPGLGVLLALLARLAERLADARSPGRWPHLPVAVTAAGMLLLAVLPDTYVWGPRNRLGDFMFPSVGQNPEKMPPDLLAIARRLDSDPAIGHARILCGEEVSSFLTPWSSKFRFVVTRPMYLGKLGPEPERRQAIERYFLMLLAHQRRVHLQDYFPRPADLPALLKKYHVGYIVTPPPLWLDELGEEEKKAVLHYFLAGRANLLSRLGFRETYKGKEYSLWRRDVR